MAKEWLGSLATLLTAVSLTLGGELAEIPPIPAAPDSGPAAVIQDCGCAKPARVYGSVDYLLWWIKANPLPPLATANPTNLPNLDSPGTSVVLGGSDLGADEQHGTRAAVGLWLNASQTVGAEISYFFIGSRTASALVGNGGAAGDPILAIPFIYVTDSFTEQAIIFSNPGNGGGVLLTVETFLQGAEANFIWNRGGGGLRWGLLGGFRFLQLQEDLAFTARQEDNGIFNSATDQFATQNRFYGGQVGARAEWSRNRLFASASGKVALGVMCQALDITGAFNDQIDGGGVTLGGVFTQPSNIGHFTNEEFSVIPEVNCNVGVNLTRNISAYVGYTFLYVSNVARPGNAIDRNINLTQSPFFGSGTLVGPAAPLPQFKQTDFWAQGLNFGILLRY